MRHFIVYKAESDLPYCYEVGNKALFIYTKSNLIIVQ